MISNYYLLPEFTPTRLQDLVLWFEPTSFRGNTWYNLAPCYSDRNHGIAYGDVGLSTWHPQFAPALEFHAEDDYVDLPLDVVFFDEMSIEILFELYDRTDASRMLGSSGDNDNEELRTYVSPDAFLALYLPDGSSTHQIFVKIGYNIKFGFVWTWKYDDGTGKTTHKVYKNGDFYSSLSFDGKVFLPKYNLRLGYWKTQGMNGKIYLARFYHKVLSEDEIRHNYTHHPLYLLQRGIDPYEFIKRKKFYFL